MRERSLISGIWTIIFFISSGLSLTAQVEEIPLAQRYIERSLQAIQEGQWRDAEMILERGYDFSSISSDLSYLLALVRFKLERPIGSVLELLRQATITDRWNRYTPEAASLLEAQALIVVRQFEQAQQILQNLFPTADVMYLQLKILALQNNQSQFSQLCDRAVNTYPLEPRFALLFFSYMDDKVPTTTDQRLLTLLIERLPVLQKADPLLPVMAVPFIQDVDERRRHIEAYRALGYDSLPILPLALEQGVIDESTVISELFAHPSLSLELLRRIWALLRTDESRHLFSEQLLSFSGLITEDSDGDGQHEARTEYRNGRITTYRYDANQDRIDELMVTFDQGLPKEGYVAPYEDPLDVKVFWEAYPIVEKLVAGDVTYIPVPVSFVYTPFKLAALVGSHSEISLLYPEREPFLPRLTERSLISFAAKIIRPGTLASTSIETIDMKNGMPIRSVETLNGKIIAILEFSLGQPSLQKLDMDLDGRLETVRRYRPGAFQTDPTKVLQYPEIYDSIESDWDGDGVFEYRELYPQTLKRTNEQ